MIRHPFLDLFTGAALALCGPLGLMLPQRIFLEMLTGGYPPEPRDSEPSEPS